MGTNRTAWHVLLAALLAQRGPRRRDVRSEVPLSTEPLRIDYLVLEAREGSDDDARTLRSLWKLLPKVAIVEYKSVGQPYRAANLDRLLAYLHLFYADQMKPPRQRSDFCGVLLVPVRTPTLVTDATALGLTWESLGDGYSKLTGGPNPLFVGEIDVIAEAEDDDLLRLFGQNPKESSEARRWLAAQLGAEEINMEMHELEGYDEVVQKLIASLPPEQRLAGLAPEQRLAGLAPEQRLAGLAPEQAVLALPDEVLRGLSDEYLATLPEPTRAAIHARIGR